jgi:hypothetical protein
MVNLPIAVRNSREPLLAFGLLHRFIIYVNHFWSVSLFAHRVDR